MKGSIVVLEAEERRENRERREQENEGRGFCARANIF